MYSVTQHLYYSKIVSAFSNSIFYIMYNFVIPAHGQTVYVQHSSSSFLFSLVSVSGGYGLFVICTFATLPSVFRGLHAKMGYLHRPIM